MHMQAYRLYKNIYQSQENINIITDRLKHFTLEKKSAIYKIFYEAKNMEHAIFVTLVPVRVSNIM